MGRGNAGWFDIWLLGGDVVVNKTQAENYLQSTNQKAIIYSEDYSSMIFLYKARIGVIQLTVVCSDLSESVGNNLSS